MTSWIVLTQLYKYGMYPAKRYFPITAVGFLYLIAVFSAFLAGV